jgi:hypothetical protein
MAESIIRSLIIEMIAETLKEETTWARPKNHEEHDEVASQRSTERGTYPEHVHKMLDHLSDHGNFKKAMSKGENMTITPMSAKQVGNTDAGTKVKKGTIEQEKAERVKKQFASGKPVTKPIVLHDTHTGHTHLLAGNTRLTYNTQVNKKPTPVHAITYDSRNL